MRGRGAVVVFLSAAAAALGGMPVEVFTVDGTVLAGEGLTVREGMLGVDGKRVPLRRVMEVAWKGARPARPPAGGWMVELAGGDALGGEVVRGDAHRFAVRTFSCGVRTVPLGRVRCIRRAGESFPAVPAGGEGARDVLVFRNGDTLEGTCERVSERGVVFSSVAGRRLHGWKELAGVRFRRRRPAPSRGTVFRLVTVFGESLAGTDLVGVEDGVRVRTRGGETFSVPAAHLWRLRVENGGFVYLSDLDPAEVEERSFWRNGYVWHFRKDGSVDGNVLLLNGKRYAKGLGVHAYCRLVYRLRKQYALFVSDVGIDDEITAYGSVEVAVKGDGRVLWKREGLDAGAETAHVAVDVSGVSVLELVVDFGKDFDVGDHVDWAGAYLVLKNAPEAGTGTKGKKGSPEEKP